MTMFVEGQDPLNTPGAPAPERSPIGAPEAPPVYRAPDFVRETIPAAFNVANPVVSVYNAMTSQSADKEFDPNHNAMEAIKGTWGESQPELFMGSRNATETQSLLARGAKENKDRQTLAAAGFPGMVAAFGAGLLDPSLAIMPWGLGGDALRVAGKMAALGALQSSVSAGAMYASQVTAKPEDALKSVASGTLLMGVLGGAIGHLAPAERAAASADIDAARGNAPAPKAKDIPDGPFARAEPPTSPIIQTWDKGQEGQNKGYIQKHTGFAGEGGISASGSMGGPKSSMGESAEDIGTITAKDGTPLRVMKTANEIAVWAKGEDIRGPEPADDPAQPWILQSWKNEADPLRSSWYKVATAKKSTWGEDKGSLEHLVVQGALQGQGIGGKLLDAAETHLGANPYSGADFSEAGAAAVENYRRRRIAENDNASALPSYVGGGGSGSLSAAEADTRAMQEKKFGLNKATAGFSPNANIYSASESLTAKRTAADLVDTPRRFEQHDEGVPTSQFPGGSAETAVRMRGEQLTIPISETYADLWKQHYYPEGAPAMGQLRAEYDALRGSTPDGKLSFKEFREAVGDASNNGDVHEIPEVQQAAQARRKMLDAVKADAQATKDADGNPMLGEELEPPKGAASFSPRIYDHAKIESDRPAFVDMLTRHLTGEQEEKAAAKDRIQKINDQHSAFDDQASSLAQRSEAMQARMAETNARLDEVDRQAKAGGAREQALTERAGDAKAAVSEVQEFIASMRGELKNPDQIQALDDLEKEAAALRKEAKPMSAAELARLEKQEVSETLTGDLRKATEIAIGKRKRLEEPDMARWIAGEGGVKDVGGDIASAYGGNPPRFGLNGKDRLVISEAEARLREQMHGEPMRQNGLQHWGEKFRDEAPEHFGENPPEPGEVGEIIRGLANGDVPQWWKDAHGGEINKLADDLAEHFAQSGAAPTTLREAAEALKSGDPLILKRLREKAAAGADVPGAEADIASRYQGRRDLQKLIDRGVERRATREVAASREGARASEASVAANRVRGRLSILSDRAYRQERMIDLLEKAKGIAEQGRSASRTQLEEEIGKWKGNSSKEAIRAIKDRDAAELQRDTNAAMGRSAEPTKRLAAADKPVNRAVRSILESDRDLSPQELRDRANQWADRTLGSPDGRFNYDDASGGPNVGWTGGEKNQVRGSLKERRVSVPYDELKPWLVRDAAVQDRAFLRSTLPDIELTKRFGDVDMTAQMKGVQEDYAKQIDALREGPRGDDAAYVAKEAKRLHDQGREDMKNLAYMRDKLRNVYGWSPNGNVAFNNMIRDAHNFTTIQSLGTSVLNRFNDIGANAVMRYGFNNVFHDLWGPLLAHAISLGKGPLGNEIKRQAAFAGVGVDGAMGHLRHDLTDVVNHQQPGNVFSRGLAWGADRSMLINMHGQWTDWMKAANWNVAQQEFARAAERIAGGKGTKLDLQRMGDGNIPPDMVTKIAQQYGEFHTKIQGPLGEQRVPNSHLWTDKDAAHVFNAAMNREANINVVTAGIGDKPRWLSTPVGGLVGQFKGFVAGAHERILVSNLQQRDKNTLMGVVTSMAMGMLSYRLYTLASGQEASERPQDWIKEGLSRSALSGWFSEANNGIAKLTAGKIDAGRLVGADRPLSRKQDNSGLSEFLGPTYSLAEKATGIVTHGFAGKLDANDIHSARSIAIPMQNLMGVRRLLDDVEDSTANAFGIKPKVRNKPPVYAQ